MESSHLSRPALELGVRVHCEGEERVEGVQEGGSKISTSCQTCQSHRDSTHSAARQYHILQVLEDARDTAQ